MAKDHFNKRLTILVPDSSALLPKPNLQRLDIMVIPRMPLLIWLPPWPLPLLLQGIHRLSGDRGIRVVSNSCFKNLFHHQEASAGPASALAQWHGGLRNAGAAALPISSPHPFHITSMGLMFQVSSRRLENPNSYHRGEAFEIGLANGSSNLQAVDS